jgi:enoyl-CoA hydratase/carnithine racemase
MMERDLQYQHISVSRDGPIDWVELRRPERLNTLTLKMVDELQDYFGRLYTDPACQAVVLSGAGEHFCAGLDLKEPVDALDAGPAYALDFMKRFGEIILRMRRCPQPICALLQGAVSGGGFALALASDIRIAAPDVKMNTAFLRLGLSGTEMGISWMLPRLIGYGRAADIILSNRTIDAAEAEKIGLVSRIVAPDELEETGRMQTDPMRHLPSLSLRLTKEALNMALAAPSLELSIEIENRHQALCFASGAVDEGRTAFLEKRAPRFPAQKVR